MATTETILVFRDDGRWGEWERPFMRHDCGSLLLARIVAQCDEYGERIASNADIAHDVATVGKENGCDCVYMMS